MASATGGLDDEPAGLEGFRRARRRRWPHMRPSSKSGKSVSDSPWSWSLGVSDWPIGKTDYDLTADQAVNAVLGLDKYYESAMTSLSEARDEDDGSPIDGTQRD
jgi:hypothetical protein